MPFWIVAGGQHIIYYQFLIFSETNLILCSILVQICSGCWWPSSLCTTFWLPWQNARQSKTNILMSWILQLGSSSISFTSAFRTIFLQQGTGPPSWKTCTVFVWIAPRKARISSISRSTCKQSHPPHTLSLEYWDNQNTLGLAIL